MTSCRAAWAAAGVHPLAVASSEVMFENVTVQFTLVFVKRAMSVSLVGSQVNRSVFTPGLDSVPTT